MTTRSRWLLWGGLFVAAVCVVVVRWQFGRDLALSRFGYLRTPRPADASPEAQ